MYVFFVERCSTTTTTTAIQSISHFSFLNIDFLVRAPEVNINIVSPAFQRQRILGCVCVYTGLHSLSSSVAKFIHFSFPYLMFQLRLLFLYAWPLGIDWIHKYYKERKLASIDWAIAISLFLCDFWSNWISCK